MFKVGNYARCILSDGVLSENGVYIIDNVDRINSGVTGFIQVDNINFFYSTCRFSPLKKVKDTKLARKMYEGNIYKRKDGWIHV